MGGGGLSGPCQNLVVRLFNRFRRDRPAATAVGRGASVSQIAGDWVTAGSDYVFPEDWWDLRGHATADVTQREAMERELKREVTRGHVLHRTPAHAIARCGHCDDVLYALTDGRFARVHLGWPHQAPDPPPMAHN